MGTNGFPRDGHKAIEMRMQGMLGIEQAQYAGKKLAMSAYRTPNGILMLAGGARGIRFLDFLRADILIERATADLNRALSRE